MQMSIVNLRSVRMTDIQEIPSFKDPAEEASLKTLQDKGKMVVTSILSFSPQYFLSFPKQLRSYHGGW